MTFVPHWTSGEDTYVTEPPDQLKSRGYIPDDVPTSEETNWIFRNLMPFRAFDNSYSAGLAMVENQLAVVDGSYDVTFPFDSDVTLTLSTGDAAAIITTDGQNIYLARNSGTSIVGTIHRSDTLATSTITFAAVSGSGSAPTMLSTDGVYVAGVSNGAGKVWVWDIATGVKVWEATATDANAVLIHGSSVYVATDAGHALQFALDDGTAGFDFENGAISGLEAITALGRWVVFGGIASVGSGDTASGTNVFAVDVTGTPSIDWEVSLDGGDTVYALSSDGRRIYAGLADSASSEVYALAPRDGATLASATSTDTILSMWCDATYVYCVTDALGVVQVRDRQTLGLMDTFGGGAGTSACGDSFSLWYWVVASETLVKARHSFPVTRTVRRRADYTAEDFVPTSVPFPNLILQPL